MMQDVALPKELHDTLKCEICEKLATTLPIYFEYDSQTFLCTECVPSEECALQIKGYMEILNKKMQFTLDSDIKNELTFVGVDNDIVYIFRLFNYSKMNIGYPHRKASCDKISFQLSIDGVNIGAPKIIDHGFFSGINVSSELKDAFSHKSKIILGVEILENQTKTDSLNTILLSVLECPVCADYMSAPIHQCKVGHSICYGCKGKLKFCPTCKSDFSDSRNFALENIVMYMARPCKYSTYNCKFVGTQGEIQSHESQCSHKPYKCTLRNCEWKGKVSDIVDHAKEMHKDMTRQEGETLYIKDFNELQEYTSEYLVHLFESDLGHIVIEYANGKLNWWSKLVSRSKQSEKFYFVLKFSDKDNQEWVAFRKECISLENDHSDQNALTFPLEIISRYVRNDNLYFVLKHYKV